MVLVAQTPSPCSERSPRRSQISPVRYTHMPEPPHAALPQRQQYQLLYHPRCNLRSVGFPEEHSVHLSERQPQVRRPRPRAAPAKHPPRGPRHYLRRLFLHARTHAPRCPLRRRSSRAWHAPSMPQRAEPPARPRRVRTPAPCTCQRCPSTAETFPRTRRPS